MKYITARVRPEKVYLGYDENDQIVTRPMPNTEFVEKVIRIDRILSFTESYIFIECPHETVQTWEYEGSLEDIKSRLRGAGMLID
ncbi:hypothetical protein [Phreatobacter sp. AB_2022a]|uniref:hypothetical protein n=1 Tax=Phreatobacter sp. AB_2022a TaxID=3003134 RepID=UPI002287488D|nr:hypothetical protein [Phreatobacter sp. AB_2022a]MCZ0737630.1 hypothetical protein [Phreatobacter sp. AB_2022a]